LASRKAADQRPCQLLLHQYNATRPDAADQKAALLHDLRGGNGKGTVIRPPFYCDFGYNIRLGSGVFLNFGCVFLLSLVKSVSCDESIPSPNCRLYVRKGWQMLQVGIRQA
jgi:maltose O-acetyltransferase